MRLRGCLLCASLLLTSGTGPVAVQPEQTTKVWAVELPLTDSVHVRVNAPRLIRVATSGWGIWLLDGRTLRTRWGTVRVAATEGGRALDLHCAPCVVRSRAIDRNTGLSLTVGLRLARDADRLSGRLVVNGLAVDLAGTLSDGGLEVDFALSEAPVRDLFGLLFPAIPELGYGQISGSIAARGRVAMPAGTLEITPELRGFEVRGLGTDRLAWGQFAYRCASASGVAQVCRSGEGAAAWLALRAVGKWLPRAVVAAEDARFSQHPGYDLTELVAALQSDLDARRFQRGGSTITQQLARSLFLTPDKTLARKLREILYAVEMEQTMGKERILALYLNTAEWGPGIHGARQAARTYFGKEPKDLRPEEAAWLAAILRNPHRAWHTQYMADMPDAERVAWVVRRMKGLKSAEKQRALTRCLRFAAVRVPAGSGPAARSDLAGSAFASRRSDWAPALME